jgi:hypothetical protein
MKTKLKLFVIFAVIFTLLLAGCAGEDLSNSESLPDSDGNDEVKIANDNQTEISNIPEEITTETYPKPSPHGDYIELIEILRFYFETYGGETGIYNESERDENVIFEDAGNFLPWDWNSSAELAKVRVAKKDFYYGMLDINGDNVPEFILFYNSEFGMHPLAIFTIHDGEVKYLLSAFERSSIEGVMNDGAIVWRGSGGVNNTYKELHSVNNGELNTFFSVCREWVWDEETDTGEFIYREYHGDSELLPNQEEAEEIWNLSEKDVFDDMLADIMVSPLFSDDVIIESSDTFDYKGLTFSGKYIMRDREVVSFILDLNTIVFDGKGLAEISCGAVIAYIANDIERLTTYFEDDEKAQWGIFYKDELQDKLNSLTYLALTYAAHGLEYDNGYTLLTYDVTFDYGETHANIRVEMFLNDKDEWKVHYIGYYRFPPFRD